MSVNVSSVLLMAIPMVILGLVLFVNRKRLSADFKANPNGWWNACFWIGLSLAFLAAIFVGWIGWGMLSYYLFPHSPMEVWVIPVPLLVIHLGVMGVGVLLMAIGKNKQDKANQKK